MPTVEKLADSFGSFTRNMFAWSSTIASRGHELSAAALPTRRWRHHRSVNNHIVFDAFSSDSIPVHLLTREAIAGYLSRLAERGVIV
jgi:hypothetical protein